MLTWFKKSFAGPGVAATRSPAFKKVAETPWHLQPGQPEPRKVEKVPGSLALATAPPVILPQNLSFHLCKLGVWGDRSGGGTEPCGGTGSVGGVSSVKDSQNGHSGLLAAASRARVSHLLS